VLGTAEATNNATRSRGDSRLGKSIRPPILPQSSFDAERWCKLTRKFTKTLERWHNHPQVQAEHDRARQLARMLRTQPRSQPPPSSKQTRRKDRGRPSKLSADTIARLRPIYRKLLKTKPKFAVGQPAYNFLRKLLPERERSVSDRTLYRCIVNPIRNDKSPH
jgi:hypothetical protein